MNSYDYYIRAIEAIQENDLIRAEKLLQESLSMEKHFKTHHELAKLLFRSGRQEEAKHHFHAAYLSNQQNDRVAFDYAKNLFGEKKTKAAKEVLRKILERNSTYGPARRLLDEIELGEKG